MRFSLAILLFLVCSQGLLRADDGEPTPAEVTAEADLPSFAEPPMTDEEKQRTATAAVYLAVGVAFVGIFLIVLVLVWGVRVRRLARKRVPSQTLPDPLWYLRTRKHGTVHEPPREPRRDTEHD